MTRLRILPLFVLVIALLLLAMGMMVVKQYEERVATPTLPVSPQPTVTEYSFAIDPMPDYTTDASFNILGPTELFVNGTTDLPAGMVVTVVIYDENKSRNLLMNTSIEIKGDASGPNFFSSPVFDMKGQPPGRYRVTLGVNETEYDIKDKTAYSRFNVTSDVPYYKWIGMDPPGELYKDGIIHVHPAKTIHVSGTTDLPSGSEILISSNSMMHSNCTGRYSQETTLVLEGTGGVNTWNYTVNSSEWCLHDTYWISAEAIDWTNVTPASVDLFLT